ncbi:rhodanese-related sulfurtransferase [Propionibacteriaceae bacterium Y1685]
MTMISKVLLYYRFTPLADPEAVRLWQHELCTRLGLTGRIIISAHGINGTVGGEVSAVKQYAKQTRSYPPFADLDLKWSDGTGQDFPRLSVRVRDEVVTFGAAEELVVDADGVVGGGQHLTPEQVHALVAERGDEVAFFDGRNAWEASIGRFAGAVVPDVDTTADFVRELESGRHDDLKNRPVITYCTGGVRCEVLSALMINRGFTEVYQLDGGIVRYGETFGDDGLWQGSLRVFDQRGRIDFSDHTTVIGRCERCDAPTSDHVDCTAPQCKGRALLCNACAADPVCADHAPKNAG